MANVSEWAGVDDAHQNADVIAVAAELDKLLAASDTAGLAKWAEESGRFLCVRAMRRIQVDRDADKFLRIKEIVLS